MITLIPSTGEPLSAATSSYGSPVAAATGARIGFHRRAATRRFHPIWRTPGPPQSGKNLGGPVPRAEKADRPLQRIAGQGLGNTSPGSVADG